MLRLVKATILLLVAGGLSVSCGGGATQPTPPRVEPPPANSPPVIRSFIASTGRTEVETPVEFVVTVEDKETAADQLTYEWSAQIGSLSGQGPKVEWRVPKGSATPANYSVRVTVVERYPALGPNGQIVTSEHRVTSEPIAVRVHDSREEIGNMSLRFLEKFGDSSVSPDACVSEFTDKCVGKSQELRDIQFNREHYRILSRSLRFQSVNVFPNNSEAHAFVACRFESQITKCEPPSEWGGPCRVGDIERVDATCRLHAVYDNGRWWLCESRIFDLAVLAPLQSPFFGSRESR